MDAATSTPHTDDQHQQTPLPASAGVLTTGLVALFLAGIALAIGQYQAVTFDGYGPTGVLWLTIAALAGLVGAVCTVMGVRTLAGHIDDLARAARNG